MKKYITVAALLAAGTALANAAEEELSVSFTGKTANSINGVLSDISLGSVEISGIDSYMITANTTVAGNSDAFTPNYNVGDGKSWTADFKFTINENVEFSFNSIDFGVIAFNSSGNNQENDGKSRSILFNIAVKDASGVSLATGLSTVNITGGTYDSPCSVVVNLKDTVELLSGYVIELTASESDSVGTYVGLKNFKLSTIPEPSAFGLLAGVGALALVASRRRRTKKA